MKKTLTMILVGLAMLGGVVVSAFAGGKSCPCDPCTCRPCQCVK